MRVALGLFGISHKESNVNWLRWWLKYDIDYRKCVDNYKKYLFDHFKSEGFDVSTYISTYKSETYEDLQTDLMKQYNPKFISMVDYQIQTPTNNLARNIIFSRLCHTILNQEESADLVLLTRFDMNFLQSLNKVRIDWNKINVVHETDMAGDYDDNFYLMSWETFKRFVEVTDKYGVGGFPQQSTWHLNGHDDCLSFHYLKPHLEKEFGVGCINTMIDGNYMAGHSPFMNFVRGYHHKPDFNDGWRIIWQGLEEQGKDYFKS